MQFYRCAKGDLGNAYGGSCSRWVTWYVVRPLAELLKQNLRPIFFYRLYQHENLSCNQTQ